MWKSPVTPTALPRAYVCGAGGGTPWRCTRENASPFRSGVHCTGEAYWGQRHEADAESRAWRSLVATLPSAGLPPATARAMPNAAHDLPAFGRCSDFHFWAERSEQFVRKKDIEWAAAQLDNVRTIAVALATWVPAPEGFDATDDTWGCGRRRRDD